MSLPRFSVNQSLFINLVSAIIIVVGLVVLMGMNREVFPNVSFDIVSIHTAYPGATPLDVEKLITTPIEKELKQVDGIKEINSTSASSVSTIFVKIDPDDSDKQKVVRDIQSAVDRTKGLPKDIADDPQVTELESKQYAIIEVSLAGKMSEQKLQKHADNLEDIIEDIDGVARASKSGYREREIHVLVDPKKMEEYYVSFDEISQALANRNISIPAGEINTETTEYSIRTTGEFLTAKEVEDVIVRANDSGNWLKIKDIATVEDSFKDEDIISKTLGTRSINLIITKKESGDALSIVDNLKEVCKDYLKDQDDGLKPLGLTTDDSFSSPKRGENLAEVSPSTIEDVEMANEGGLSISYVNDYSFFARRRLNVLRNNVWFGIVIILGILMIFLQKRVAILTFLGVPIAFFATFIVMSIMGITINLISMFGLIIVLGMLVDDGIIVAENIYRYMEGGMPPREAAVKGSEEVMGAVTTAVFTTMAAFAPLLFMSGIIGKFIKNVPTIVIIALLASLGEALIILPSHMADFVKVKLDSLGKPIALSKDMPWFKKLISGYTKIVTSAIRHKYRVLAGFTIVLIVTIIAAGTVLKFILFPSAGINYIFIRGETAIGAPLEKTHNAIKPVEKVVSELPKEELDTYVTTVGKTEEDRWDPYGGQASNLVQLNVYLTPDQDRKRNVDEIIQDLRERTKNVEGFEELKFDKPESGPPVGKPVEVKIRGEEFNTLDEVAFEFMDYMKDIDGIYDVSWNHKPGKEEIRINVDREKATMAGLSMQQIARTIRTVFEGEIATKIKPVKAEEETDVTVKFKKEDAKDMSVFENILVYNKFGNLIPLKKVAQIDTVPGTTSIYHLDGKRVITVSSNIDTNKATSIEVNKKLENEFKNISKKYPGYSVKYGGEQEESVESVQNLGKAFILAFLIMYLLLSSFFRSLIQPLIVMLAIPFGLIGVVIAFMVHGLPLSFMAIFGIVGLSGIVVNDSIVLVDFINKLRNSGMSRRESIIKAGQMRIRPVILTTVTTFGGLSTVAYGLGGKDPFLVPMAMSICWGLVFATGLTLVMIPCVYSILDDIALKITHHSSMIETKKLQNGNKE